MEIGLDYMQMRTQAQYYGLRWAGIAFLVAGALLVIMGLAYYGNLFWLRSSVDNYAASRSDAIQLAAGEAPLAPQEGKIVSPLALEPGAYTDTAAGLGFTPVTQSDARPLGTLPPAQRLIVPELGINVKMHQASLTGGAILAHSNSTGSDGLNIVEANPGERGALWFFGESGKRADNFGGLTRAPELLTRGDDILIFVDNGSRTYVYAATHTDVFRAADLRLSGSERATVHLSVPVPSGLYDHFLVLSGELVGVQ